MSIVSNNIKYLRRINQLTQEQFARRIGIKRSLVGAYEEARANPNLDNLKLMANLFGVSVDALIKTDIRKLKQTPDITFDYETEEKPVQPPTIYSNQRPKVEPKSLAELMQGVPDERIREQKKIEETLFKNEETINPTVLDHQEVKVTNENHPIKESNVYHTQQAEELKIIRKHNLIDYLRNTQNSVFIKTLDTCTLPFFKQSNLRVFEAPEDFMFKNSFFVCRQAKNEKEIIDGKQYVILSKLNGMIFRRVYNQIAIKGNLLLSIDFQDLPSHEIAYNDIIEIWEVVGLIQMELPPPPTNFAKVNSLIEQLKNEVDRIKK